MWTQVYFIIFLSLKEAFWYAVSSSPFSKKLDIKLANWHFGPEKELWVFIDLHFCSTKVHSTHFDFIQKMFKNIFCKINVSSWATKESTRIYEVSPWGLNWMLRQPLGYSTPKNESICFYNATTTPSVMQWEIVPSLCTLKGCCKKLFVTQMILISLVIKWKKYGTIRSPKLIVAFLSSSRFAFEIHSRNINSFTVTPESIKCYIVFK